jgi:hypothetical protein
MKTINELLNMDMSEVVFIEMRTLRCGRYTTAVKSILSAEEALNSQCVMWAKVDGFVTRQFEAKTLLAMCKRDVVYNGKICTILRAPDGYNEIVPVDDDAGLCSLAQITPRWAA